MKKMYKITIKKDTIEEILDVFCELYSKDGCEGCPFKDDFCSGRDEEIVQTLVEQGLIEVE